MLGRYTWVCAICGQGFTRKTSARRHNDNLHLEQANIVRPLDYVIGRVSGDFTTPADPILYRARRKKQTLFKRAEFTSIAHESTNPSDRGNISEKHIDDRVDVASYGRDPAFQGQYKSVDVNGHPRAEIAQTSIFEKLLVFRRLSYKYYPRDVAERIVRGMQILIFYGDKNFLDKSLAWLLSIDSSSVIK